MDDFDITVTHPDYDAYLSTWQMMRDTVDGEDCVKAKGETYLPMKSGMKAITDMALQKAAYDGYKIRAEFPEIVSPTVQGSVGLIHSKPQEIKLPAGMEYLREKATKDGLTLDDLYRRVTTEVMRMGRFGLMPGVKLDGTFHIAGYVTEAIRNWDAPEGPVDFLVLDESGVKRDPATNKWEMEERYRENVLLDGKFFTREWLKEKDKDGKEKWTPQGELLPSLTKSRQPLGEIPFVFIGATDLTPAPDEVPLYGLAKLALRAYRLDADYATALHMTSEPTPYVTGVDAESAPKTIGAASLWVLPDVNSKADFLEFTGPGIQAQEKAIENTLMRAIIFGAQLFADTRRAAESGEAKKLRLGNQQASLKSVAMSAAAGLQMVLRYIATWGGFDPMQVEVTPNLDFVDRALAPQEIVNLVAGWQSGAYSKRTLFENLQRGEIINPSKTFEDEEDEIGDDPLPEPREPDPNQPPRKKPGREDE